MYGSVTPLPGISTWYAEATELEDDNESSTSGSDLDLDNY